MRIFVYIFCLISRGLSSSDEANEMKFPQLSLEI